MNTSIFSKCHNALLSDISRFVYFKISPMKIMAVYRAPKAAEQPGEEGVR